jgi:hypothetical protein
VELSIYKGERMSEPLEPRQIKMEKGQWDFLKKLGRELGYHDARGDHSRLVREIVSAAAVKWQESPYICYSSRHTVLITRDGHIFYRQVQGLRLNKKRERLPCSVQIKPEKKQDYRLACPSGDDEASWFRSRWLLNYFAVYHGKDISQGAILESFVDRSGTDGKMADLLVEQGPDSFLVKEMVVALKEFVLWRGPKRGDDRVGIPIDIPTRNLELVVAVDTDLYRKSPLAEYEIPKLALEFRNPESARFESEAIAHDRWNPMDLPLVGRHTKDTPEPDAGEISSHLVELGDRINALMEARAFNGEVVPPEKRLEVRSAFEIPSSFLYFKTKWPSPQFGVEVCVRWERPVRVS